MSENNKSDFHALDYATAYINAGGRGTRVSPALPESFTDTVIGVSKAFLEVGVQKTFLIDHHIRKLLRAGFHEVVAGVGDHRNVGRYVNSTYAGYSGVKAIESQQQRGTGGDLLDAIHHNNFFRQSIFVNNVDTLLDIDEADFLDAHHSTGAGMTIALTRRAGVPNQGAFNVDTSSKVIYSAEATVNPIGIKTAARKSAWNGSSTGAVFVDKDLLADFSNDLDRDALSPVSLYRDIIGYALGQGALYAYDNHLNFFLDVGTVDTWHQAEEEAAVIQSYLSI